MESQFPVATREELWRLQEEIKDLFATQGQHSERIMRLEKRRDEDTRVKNVWGAGPQFSGPLGNSALQGELPVVKSGVGLTLIGQQRRVSVLPLRPFEILTRMRILA